LSYGRVAFEHQSLFFTAVRTAVLAPA